MSLSNLIKTGASFEEVDPGYISEAAMEQLEVAIAMETLNTAELEQYINESTSVVTESQKNIVKLNKAAQKQKWYKIGVLQAAAEGGQGKGDKDYRKLRKLWKLEARLFNRLEKKYKNKAMAKAREAMKNMGKKKGIIATAGERAQKVASAASQMFQKGPIKTK